MAFHFVLYSLNRTFAVDFEPPWPYPKDRGAIRGAVSNNPKKVIMAISSEENY